MVQGRKAAKRYLNTGHATERRVMMVECTSGWAGRGVVAGMMMMKMMMIVMRKGWTVDGFWAEQTVHR